MCVSFVKVISHVEKNTELKTPHPINSSVETLRSSWIVFCDEAFKGDWVYTKSEMGFYIRNNTLTKEMGYQRSLLSIRGEQREEADIYRKEKSLRLTHRFLFSRHSPDLKN